MMSASYGQVRIRGLRGLVLGCGRQHPDEPCASGRGRAETARTYKKRDLAARVVGAGEAWVTELDNAALRELFSLARDAVVIGGDRDPEEAVA